MKTKLALTLHAGMLVLFTLGLQPAIWAQGTAFTYQGRLDQNGANPASGSYDLTFALFSVSSGAGQVAGTLTNTATAVSNGLFTVTLDFGGNFPGADRWLEIGVRTNGGGAFTTLTPRQKLTPTPYAITANNVTGVLPNAGLSGTYGNAVTFNNAGNSFSGNGGGLTNVNASNLSSGTVPAAALGNAWKTTGNGNTSPGPNFIGTTDNQPLEVWAGGRRALRLEPNFDSPNVIGGSASNSVSNGIFGATIGGGTYLGAGIANSVSGNYGTVSGGGGNAASGFAATVGGGGGNTNSGQYATVGGGFRNTNSGQYATVSGGDHNTNSGNIATVGGGEFNTASGTGSTVPGGYQNLASGSYSFAAGLFAQANHDGAFVWADSFSASPFPSTTLHEFSVRAHGGVRFVTSGAGMTLDGQPVVTTNALTNLSASSITSGTLGDARLSGNVPLLNAGLYTFAGDLAMSGGAAYHNLSLSGGNALGYLYGSFPAFGDGIHLGYNYYADANGTGHVVNAGGGTSRISVGYNSIILATGAVGVQPNFQNIVVGGTTVTVNGTLTVNGTFNNFSDRSAKQDFAPVSPSQILDKVMRLPVSEWSYKVDAATRHIGPMAQDFYSVFNLGTDDRHIATVDESGVALAAIQALNEKLNNELKRCDAENAELKQRLEALEKIIDHQK